MTRSRSPAMICGLVPVPSWKRSSSKDVADPAQRFHYPAPTLPAGQQHRVRTAVSEVMA